MSGSDPSNEWGWNARERERVQAIWARTVRTFLAACLEHQSSSDAVDAISIIGRGAPNYFHNTELLSKALLRLRSAGLSPAFTEVLEKLLYFYHYYLARDLPDSKLPTCRELEDWYSETRGKARDLLERKAL